MSDFVTEPVLNTALDTITITSASLHDGDPGPLGLANELTQATYQRQPVVFTSAVNGQRQLFENASFEVVTGPTITHIGYWDGSIFKASSDIPDIPISGDGEIILNSVTTFIGF